jgi:CheY-like chemotaxis protein
MIDGPIIIIEDDMDDQEIIQTTLNELHVKNEIVFFHDADAAYEYISRPEVIPFLILSDIKLPGNDGFYLRDKIHAIPDLRLKCVPYIFLTIGTENKFIWQAYSNNAQGFFIKPSTMQGWKQLLFMTIHYWENSKKPVGENPLI